MIDSIAARPVHCLHNTHYHHVLLLCSSTAGSTTCTTHPYVLDDPAPAQYCNAAHAGCFSTHMVVCSTTYTQPSTASTRSASSCNPCPIKPFPTAVLDPGPAPKPFLLHLQPQQTFCWDPGWVDFPPQASSGPGQRLRSSAASGSPEMLSTLCQLPACKDPVSCLQGARPSRNPLSELAICCLKFPVPLLSSEFTSILSRYNNKSDCRSM
jgi:hypothetical protein